MRKNFFTVVGAALTTGTLANLILFFDSSKGDLSSLQYKSKSYSSLWVTKPVLFSSEVSDPSINENSTGNIVSSDDSRVNWLESLGIHDSTSQSNSNNYKP